MENKYGLGVNVDISEKNSLSYVSSSKIKLAIDSPITYAYRYFLDIKTPPTKAMIAGKIIHKALLEPSDFLVRYKVMPKFSGTGSKARKQEWFSALPKDSIVIEKDFVSDITNMIDSLHSHEKASNLLNNGLPEVKVLGRDKENETDLFGIPDLINGDYIIDVKKTASADQESVERDIFKYGYYIQSSFYKRLLHAVTGKSFQFVWIFVEIKEPYNINICFPDDGMVDGGDQICDMGIKEVLRLNEKFSNIKYKKDETITQAVRRTFHSYNENSIVSASLPGWAFGKLEEKIYQLKQGLK